MEWVRLNFSDWVATWSGKAEVRLSVTLAQLKRPILFLRQIVTEVEYRAKTGYWHLQEELWEKEHTLARLLGDSGDPVVVTDDSRRFLAANKAALALFGISRANIREFTIDVFVPESEVHCFERSGPPFIKEAERFGECRIRRLDGGSKIVEYSFQPNFVLGRHLSKFHDVTPQKQIVVS